MLVITGLIGLTLGGLLTALALRKRPPGAPTAAPVLTALTDPLVPGSRAVLEALPVAVVVVDVADEVLLGNRSARALGLIRDGVLAAVPELRSLVRETRWSDSARHSDLAIPLHAGRPHAIFLARAAPVGDGTVAVLLEDVTEARRLEDVRRDFVANVSHELKTPVGALTLLSEALQSARHDPDAVGRFAAQAEHEAGRLARLVQELIDLSRLQGADPLPTAVVVAVGDVVNEATARVALRASALGMTIDCHCDAGLQVLGSSEQLVTAVANLLDNAASYSAAGSAVRVTATTVRDMVEIAVRDEGIGIEDKDIERIFERFYRADPARSRATGGTGLGLAIVKHIVGNHGGSVGVVSAPGDGATFRIRLPMAPAASAVPA